MSSLVQNICSNVSNDFDDILVIYCKILILYLVFEIATNKCMLSNHNILVSKLK